MRRTAPPAQRCVTCGEEHQGLTTVFGPPAPDPWASATDEERNRGGINRDTCVITIDDTTSYVVRGELPIPVRDAATGAFAWSVWVSLSEQNMRTLADRWYDPGRESLPPMFGWLCNELSPYPSTTHLATNVHTRAPGVEGITIHRVAELNRLLRAT
ncbi:DUF2199 domain-containing protein [Luteimicrobium subarcticum]|nr:DUF2199 domain-containing protein [Luteimicrobium subarcticum]